MSATGESLVRAERTGRLLVVRMCREAKRNAVNRQLADELDAAFNLLEDDDGLWAGVLTGTGSVFCAGSDLTAGGDYLTERGGEYGLIRRRRRKPLIAAVEGSALGGGMELVLACDLVVASRTARFGLPEVSRGVVASSGALFMAPRALPANLARELLLTGEPIDADRALRRRAGERRDRTGRRGGGGGRPGRADLRQRAGRGAGQPGRGEPVAGGGG